MLPTPPVLMMVFNRPDLTALSLQTVRAAKPAQLFVSADGPRDTHPDDARLCEETRAVFDQVDWDCEVKTLYRDKNVGLQEGMSSGISWFFENVEAGIIMEDDNVPHASFFRFAAEMLDRYRDDERIMSVGGDNCSLNETGYETEDSYIFSILPMIWGWATWRRAWQHYDHSMSAWDTKASRANALSHFTREHVIRYWDHEFTESYKGNIKTCGYRWVLSCLARGGLHVIPTNNVCSNVGFGEEASHTFDPDSPCADRELVPIEFPLKHPEQVARTLDADLMMHDVRFQTERWYRKNVVGKRFHRRVLRKIKRTLTAS